MDMKQIISFFFSILLFISCKSVPSSNNKLRVNSSELEDLIRISNDYISQLKSSSKYYTVGFSISFSNYKIFITPQDQPPCYYEVEKHPLKSFKKMSINNTEIYYHSSFILPQKEVESKCNENDVITILDERKVFTLLLVCKLDMNNVEVKTSDNPFDLERISLTSSICNNRSN